MLELLRGFPGPAAPAPRSSRRSFSGRRRTGAVLCTLPQPLYTIQITYLAASILKKVKQSTAVDISSQRRVRTIALWLLGCLSPLRTTSFHFTTTGVSSGQPHHQEQLELLQKPAESANQNCQVDLFRTSCFRMMPCAHHRLQASCPPAPIMLRRCALRWPAGWRLKCPKVQVISCPNACTQDCRGRVSLYMRCFKA